MLSPARLHHIGVEPTLGPDEIGIEQVLCPTAQRTLDPLADGDRESRFRPVDKLPRDHPVKELTDDVLAAAVANLEVDRNSRRELRHAMIEEWDARLERNRHRGAVDLRQDVIGKVGDRIAPLISSGGRP